MNDCEKRVLRRKKDTIAAHYNLTKDRIKALEKAQLLTPAIFKVMQFESTNYGKMCKFLEQIVPKAGPTGFRELCGLFEDACIWLGDELRAELRLEEGNLKIDDHVQVEADILVQREYGHVLRLTREEKKELQALVALRTQCAKEVWKRRLEKAERELTTQVDINRQKVQVIRGLIEKLHLFRRMNSGRLQTELLGDHAPEPHHDEDSVGVTIEDMLSHEVDEVKTLASQALTEKERLLMEKARAFRMLEVTDTTAKLDKEVASAIAELGDQLTTKDTETNRFGKKTSNLTVQMRTMKQDLDRQVKTDTDTLKDMRGHLSLCRDKMRDLNSEIGKLKREFDAIQEDMTKYRVKADLLDKNRRLGYLHEKTLTNPKDELPESIVTERGRKKPGAKKSVNIDKVNRKSQKRKVKSNK